MPSELPESSSWYRSRRRLARTETRKLGRKARSATFLVSLNQQFFFAPPVLTASFEFIYRRYAHRAGCSRFFLTNYSTTIGVRIDHTTLEAAVLDLEAHGKRACHQRVKIQVCSATHEFSKDSNDKLPS
jgi:hypothetical protein